MIFNAGIFMLVKNYLLVVMMAFVCSQGMYAMDQDAQSAGRREDSNLRHFVRSLGVGAVAGVIEISATQPLFYFKTCAQKGIPIPWRRPSTWYRGYVVNAGSNAPITAIQLGAKALLTSALAEDGRTLSDHKKVFVSAVSGALSALVCPAEYVMTCQQDTGKAFVPTARALWSQGFKSIYRGFTPTMIRDGGYAAGYLAIAPLVTRKMMEHVDNQHLATLSGGVLTGVGATVFTQPFDMIRGTMQLNAQGNVRETIKRLYKEGGVLSFWRGGWSRGAEVVVAITLMSSLTDSLSRQFAALDLE